MNFVHLNVHSHYSKGWGIATIEGLCRSAKEQGMKKLALTDTNGLYGLIFFLQTAREMGIHPIVGSEIRTGDRRAVLGEPASLVESEEWRVESEEWRVKGEERQAKSEE